MAIIHTCTLTATTSTGEPPPPCKACQEQYGAAPPRRHGQASPIRGR